MRIHGPHLVAEADPCSENEQGAGSQCWSVLSLDGFLAGVLLLMAYCAGKRRTNAQARRLGQNA
ncbi:MAG TPA: hypothetical protein DCY27_12305 [Desulfobacterales bacterium]|nr:hypothetical protein [Desulfobacterales bacterium]